VRAGEDLTAVAQELGIDRRRLYEWRDRAQLNGLEALRGPGRPRGSEGKVLTPLRGLPPGKGELAQRRIEELEREVAQQELDLDFFSASLAACEGKTAGGRRAWEAAVYEVIQPMTKSQGALAIDRLCRLPA